LVRYRNKRLATSKTEELFCALEHRGRRINMRVDKLTSFEAETLIRFFLNHLQPELRGKLMVELPVVYRKLLDRPVDGMFKCAVKAAVPVIDWKDELSRWIGENGRTGCWVLRDARGDRGYRTVRPRVLRLPGSGPLRP
jgi:hypothetical protein